MVKNTSNYGFLLMLISTALEIVYTDCLYMFMSRLFSL